MRNLIIFLSTFTLTILIVLFASAPANAMNGAGGSWGDEGTPVIYPPNPNCPTSTNPYTGGCGGGGSGGSGGGGTWVCYKVLDAPSASTPEAACTNFQLDQQRKNGTPPSSRYFMKYKKLENGYCTLGNDNGWSTPHRVNDCTDTEEPPPPPPPDIPPPFPDLPPPTPDCNVCAQLYQIQLKLNVLKNYDIYNIDNSINDMSVKITQIDNSITDLSTNVEINNNNLTMIDNSISNLITNIENNNITQNEIKNEVTNIYETMNDYSLQLGDIKMAMGDIDVKLDNTNKLVLSLKPDIEFIKNNLVNGSPEGKDYTEQLNEIIELLKPCEPTAEQPCPDDDAIVKKLKEIQDYMQADFEPGTDSTAVEVEDLTDIELDRNLIKFGVAQCPPDNEFSTMVNGFSFSGGFKHKPLCDFFTLLSPFIKAFGGFSAALILGGGLRRG